jgi:UDP-N-acetylmuramoyl-tripeptide--D-alanyl-D-alanine ligase
MLNVKQILEATFGKLLNGNTDYFIRDYALDSRNIKEDDFFIPIVGNKSNAHDYIVSCVDKGISGYFIEASEKNKDEIVSKTINIKKDIIIIEISKSEDALYEIGKLNRKLHMNIPIIAVTGSVGKTSTREMISSILSQKYKVLTTYKNYNGYIGLSLMLLKLENQDIAVLEHGIDYLGEMDKLASSSKPNIAVVTMIGTAHIGIFGSKEIIFKEKMDIAKYMDKNCTVVINAEDEYLRTYKNDNLNLLRYSIEEIENLQIKEIGSEFITNTHMRYIRQLRGAAP